MTFVPSFKLANILKKIFLILCVLGLNTPLFPQKNISFEYKNVSLRSAFIDLMENYKISIIFPDDMSNILINVSCEECSLDEALSSMISSTSFTLEKNGNQYVIRHSREKEYFGISGRVIDFESGESISYANIYLPSLYLGDISNYDGIFSIPNIPVESCSLHISYIGYEKKTTMLEFPKDEKSFHQILLKPKILSSEEISITGLSKEFMNRSNIPGQISFSPRHIATLPNLGEVDIFRSLQFLPGVQLGLGETSALYIRGGLPDQNLVLIDGMPIYQTGHMFGFVSGVCADAIKDIQIYKGSIPSKYGGKISSVIDITTRSGNNINAKGTFYGNLMSQGITIELPVLKRGSLMVNFRKSNPLMTNHSKLYSSIEKYVTGDDRFNLLSETAFDDDKTTSYSINSSYQDLTNKLSILINPRHKLTITQLNGSDGILEDREYFGFSSILGGDSIYIEENTNINNAGSVINWSSNWNHAHTSNLSLSRYKIDYSYNTKQFSPTSDNTGSIISNVVENNDFSEMVFLFHQQYKGISGHTISSGIEQKTFSVNYLRNTSDGTSKNQLGLDQKDNLSSIFFEDLWNFKNLFEFRSGLRIAYLKNNKHYYAEPRFAMNFKINPKLSLESSVGKHNQFVHYVNDENKITGVYSNWIISSKNIPIVSSTNYHFGMNLEFKKYSSLINMYYRNITNLFYLEEPMVTLASESDFNTKIDIGTGTKQGLELLIRKKLGLISGWASYHINKTIYDFPNLNNGEVFLANHDKTHELKIVLLTRIMNFDLAANWVFSSGGLFTDLDNMYIESGSGYNIVTMKGRNNNRLPPIHHLDLSISKTWKISPAFINAGFSVYNIYNKNNYSHKRYNPYTSELSIKSISMFGITPSAYLKISF